MMEKEKIGDFNYDEFLKLVSERFKKLLAEKNLSSYQFINISGLSNGRVSDLLHGRSNITLWTLLKICDALDIKPEEFFKNM